MYPQRRFCARAAARVIERPIPPFPRLWARVAELRAATTATPTQGDAGAAHATSASPATTGSFEAEPTIFLSLAYQKALFFLRVFFKRSFWRIKGTEAGGSVGHFKHLEYFRLYAEQERDHSNFSIVLTLSPASPPIAARLVWAIKARHWESDSGIF